MMNQKKSRTPASISPRPLKLWLDTPSTQDLRIEIVPLIDIIFCILTFFILAAVGLSRQQAIKLDLPRATTGTPQMREMLVVSLDDFAQIYVGNQQVQGKPELLQAVKDYLLLQPNGLVVLRAARNTNYDEVVEVIDILREGGSDRVALATIPSNGEEGFDLNPNPFPGNNIPNLNPSDPLNPFDPLNPSTQNNPLNPFDPLNPSTPTNPLPGNSASPSTPSSPSSPNPLFPTSPENNDSQSGE